MHHATLANSSGRVTDSAMRPNHRRAGPYSQDYSLGVLDSNVSQTASPAPGRRGAAVPFSSGGMAWAPAEGPVPFDDNMYSVDVTERALRNFEIYHNL